MATIASTPKRYDGEALKAQRARRTNARRLRHLLLHVLLIGLLFVMLYPVIWMVLSSLRPQEEIFAGLGILPRTWTLQNYVAGWNFFGNVSFATFYMNSFVICLLSMIGNVTAACLAGYAFARLKFRWKSFWFALMLGSIMLPIHAQLIPQYIAFVRLGWVNTILPLVVPKFLATDAFFIFLMVQFIRTLPRELDDAARLDGCGHFGIFGRVVIPLAIPALGTVALFTFIYTWNDFLGPLLYLSRSEQWTVAQGLAGFLDATGQSSFGSLFAMSALSLTPIVGFFLAAQKLLVEGIATSGLK